VLTIVFGVISLAGGAIGIFSILVATFGIANIMFVSVRERTSLIGIKKALGARRLFILLEFLIESILLCLIGGAIGLLLVFAESFILEDLIRQTAEIEFEFSLSMKNILLGLVMSVVVGVLAGFIPALQAAKMNPVDAIRGK
jgi:putative ABC transport system permease protein